MITFKDYIAYLKDNPQGYWFKRKLYGWGWTPATREGWLAMLAFLLFLLGITLRLTSNGDEVTLENILEFYAELIVGVIFLLLICWKKGEKPRWQWGIPKDKKESANS